MVIKARANVANKINLTLRSYSNQGRRMDWDIYMRLAPSLKMWFSLKPRVISTGQRELGTGCR